jgi:hypothetical protein
MKSILNLLCLALLFAACQPKKMEEQAATDSTQVTTPAEPVGNQLTDQQKADGWKLLFDGTSKTGWRTFKNLENDSWEVSEGTLHCKAFKDSADNKRADLMTQDEYENFELVFDWKISPQGNSGVMFRVTEEYDQPYATGPEYQVLDDEGYPGDPKDVHLTGGNYDMHAATEKKANPIGEWNQSKLIVNGNHVEHWLNGTQVLAYELNSDDWNNRRKASKWKDFPGYGKAKKGHIDLQDHSHEVWFKNIMIKPL